MAFHVHVDLRHWRRAVCDLADSERALSDRSIREARHLGRLADGRHYFLFGPKPAATGQYNPLQKLAYTSALLLGTLSLLTGMVMYKPSQLSTLGPLFGGYHRARLVHFLAMCGLLAFIPGHLVITGWKRRPDYEPRRSEL